MRSQRAKCSAPPIPVVRSSELHLHAQVLVGLDDPDTLVPAVAVALEALEVVLLGVVDRLHELEHDVLDPVPSRRLRRGRHHQVLGTVVGLGGAASVLLRKPRCYAEVYNDLDEEVVNLFRVLRDPEGAARLIAALDLTPFSRREFEDAYEQTNDPVERARRLVARCLMGFGSAAHNPRHQTGFRATNRRASTTPAHDWRNYPGKLPAIIDRLRGVVIESRPALEVIAQQDASDTLFYVDPPYVHGTRGSIRWQAEEFRCYVHELTDDDHRDLAAVLHQVEGMVVLSGYRCDLYEEIFGSWWSTERDAVGDGAVARTEVLWLNPAAERMQTQRSLFRRAP